MSAGDEAGRRALRRRAEARLRTRPLQPSVAASEDVLRLIHELQVHQVELELQNDELRRARDELEASATRFTELYDFAPVSYLTLDAGRTILEINLVGAALLGKDRAELVGQRFDAWVTPATFPELRRLLDGLESEERGSCEIALRRSGESVYLHVDAVLETPVRSTGRCFRAALTDVTAIRAAASLREANSRKSSFLAVLSHELRNPLAAITSAIDLLKRVEPASASAQRAHAVIDRQTAQLTRLVDDLLDLTRIERGKVELKPELLDLRDVVRATCEDYRGTFEQGAIELRVVEPASGVNVRGDRARLSQVVGNLLHNASKFTQAGGVVTVEIAQSPGRGELRVSDTGSGISSQQLGSLFEPFAQAEQGLARTHGGLGLGLSLVRGLVEMHRGTVKATSPGPGRGAQFLVSLPLVEAAAPGRPKHSPPPPPRCIVLIEDNADAATMLADLLTVDGHHVEVAVDGRSGLELVRRLKPDLVFCDIGLPDRSGYEVADELRRDPTLRNTRVVALSGYAQPEDRSHAREAGFDAHLAKPPSLEDLEALLRSPAAPPA